MEKKGIKLTTLIIILILLVLVEGFYIVKSNSNKYNEKTEEPIASVSQNQATIEQAKENTDSEAKAQANSQEENQVKGTEKNTNSQKSGTSTKEIVNFFGYDINTMADNILDSIEKYASEEYILKSTTGDVTAGKLTKEEAKQNRETYKTKILESLNNKEIVTKISFENDKLICTYNFEKILNSLELGSHMHIGTETDGEGFKNFEF